ncbi:MAG: PilZ domain-containing protein [Nitrospinota bacterium]|nr:MAG: PilZ domain-containing protein [Nitrospinota bacterium]
MMFERRKFPRLSQEYHISYQTIAPEQFRDNPIASLAVNISGGGICFRAREALPKDTMIALEISSERFRSPILALARVVWCKSKKEAYEIGAEFWWIGWQDNEAQTAIADYVAREVATHKQSA